MLRPAAEVQISTDPIRLTLERTRPIAAPPEWPLDLLDIPALRLTGWKPVPFRHFVLKIHGRCNLSCTYCYMYELADQSWRSKPRAMDTATIGAVCDRIAEHVHTHSLAAVDVVLHGGEPLLAGVAVIRQTVMMLRRAVPSPCDVRIQIQTNAILLDERVLSELSQLGIRVGVSLDGAAEDNDRHRRYADGRGSYAAVSTSLRLLASPPHRHLFSGILSTVDVAADPVRTYAALLEFSPPAIDFLLPHGNWSEQPPGRTADLTPSRYSSWLVAVFERWYRAPVAETRIRFFEQIMNVVLGGQSSSEAIGLSPVGVVVVDTDGAIEQVDALRSAYDGASGAGLDVVHDAFDDALAHPGVVARQIGVKALHPDCLACPVRNICGGGHYPHRYRAGAGYRNRSVYCADLRTVIDHISNTVLSDVRRLSERNVP